MLWIPVEISDVWVVLVIDRNGFEIFRLENLIAIQTSDIINPIAPR
ncbi:MAG TPA: hypothetical protein VN610_02265 [Bryobacteraceae bacterium]|nr:hypothetical protein [Bryobacteraceae bacterium]